MIYPSSFEEKIGFDAVRAHIAELCSSPLGVSRCMEMEFSANYSEVRARLEAVGEMTAIISSDSDFPISNIHDKRKLLNSLRAQGSFPHEGELIGLRASLGTMADIAYFFIKLRKDDEPGPYPVLG
ncbi:MAG: endonuclease MutS2, partial [Muribaculaceae bacterium]|nr:endonuclease MutS2 [Muribaculaceae bacterium]